MTGLHLATVGFSARNYLAFRRAPLSVETIRDGLDLYWRQPGIELREVQSALDELERRAMVRRLDDGTYIATEQKICQLRPPYGALAEDDPRAWEGWI